MTRCSKYPRALLAAALGLGACTGAIGDGDEGTPPGVDPTPGAGGRSGGKGKPPGAGGAGATAEAPGRTPLRRLTRAQYNNTIRDLLGLTGDFAAAFAGDEDAGGFHSNIVSPVSEQQLEQYHRAAEDLAAKAVAAGVTRLAPCAPPKAAPAACGDELVRNFGKRAFRRPLTTEEVDRYKQVFAAGSEGGDFAGGVALVVTAMLESPNFLYIPELGDRRAAEKDALPLDPYETASRLSYFLVGSMPDEDLFAAADAGTLRSADQIGAQARRLLGAARARESIASFYRQWLELPEATGLGKDATRFPEATPALGAAMHEEIAAFSSRATLEGDGKLETVLTAGYSFPSGPLAELYGVPAAARAAANGTTRIDLPKGERAGLFTLAGVMAVYAHPDQTGPVGRGYLVSDKLLCKTPPPAPDDVNAMLPKPDPKVTTRERLEKHRADPKCASCHALMDPYGLTFEHYDAVGRYRMNDGEKAVDATGKDLPGVGDVKDATELLARLAKSDNVRDCLVKQWFRYGFGRVEQAEDDATLAAARAAFASADFGLRDLMVGLAQSRGFRYRTLAQP